MRVLLLASLILTTGLAHATGLLAVIIDDIGNNAEVASAVLALPPGVTLSILPRLSASHQAAEAASRLGHEVMLHQPMESLNHRALGPGGLTLDHTRIDLEMVLAANLRSVPHAVGVNNHMGSLLTSEHTSMHWLMEALLRHGGLFFVDSRTNPRSVAQSRRTPWVSPRRAVTSFSTTYATLIESANACIGQHGWPGSRVRPSPLAIPIPKPSRYCGMNFPDCVNRGSSCSRFPV